MKVLFQKDRVLLLVKIVSQTGKLAQVSTLLLHRGGSNGQGKKVYATVSIAENQTERGIATEDLHMLGEHQGSRDRYMLIGLEAGSVSVSTQDFSIYLGTHRNL